MIRSYLSCIFILLNKIKKLAVGLEWGFALRRGRFSELQSPRTHPLTYSFTSSAGLQPDLFQIKKKADSHEENQPLFVLYVETEEHNVAVFNDVFFTF